MNTGNLNTGNLNTGDRNTGNLNTGNLNAGNLNTGDLNTGNLNTGNLNTGDRNTGYLNTDTPTVRLFNKDSGLTFEELWEKRGFELLNYIPRYEVLTTEWRSVSREERTEELLTKYPEIDIADGYLYKFTNEEQQAEIDKNKIVKQKWFNDLGDSDKQALKNLPNFDPEIFKEITGIDVEQPKPVEDMSRDELIELINELRGRI